MSFNITKNVFCTAVRRMLVPQIHRNFSTTHMAKMTVNSVPIISDVLRVEEEKGLRKITLIDKKTRNSLSLKTMTELINAIELNQSSQDLRCIVITNEKNASVFSAGHNLKDLTADKGQASQTAVFAKCTELALTIQNAEVPIVCLVRGLAAAGGCQLVAACDFAIATEDSKFSTPGASFGIFCSTPGVAISRVVPRSTAAYMVFTGSPLTAQEAMNAGLVTKVVPESEIDQTLLEIYAQIQSKSRSVIKLGKRFFYQHLRLPLEEALRQGESVMVKNLQMTDSQEGLNSFVEKRKPKWSHLEKDIPTPSP